MDYTFILNEIKPTVEEENEIKRVSDALLNFINDKCFIENIDAEAVLVGSVSKKTYLRGK